MRTLKFTKEIKDRWLTALKSKKYLQGFGMLKDKDNSYCCLGVLADCIEELQFDSSFDNNPYDFIKDQLGKDVLENLYTTNDVDWCDKSYARDYSNVIPIIEQLPTQD